MLYDVNAQTRRREAERRELNRPVVVKPTLSLGKWPAARDAAVMAWFDRLCKFYDIDPTAPTRWEQLAMRLAFDHFPNFALLDAPPKVGNPGTKDGVKRLFETFESYQVPPGPGSKYKKFWREHRAACAACNIKTDRSLKEAMRRARRQAEQDRAGLELLLRHAAASALGITL
jgi:hypothetical protein